ncbi:hypothetical protein IDJ75_11125 [Mucilaginibacter rigui]|uniref:Uncharacterized protein n=1 Tax=Mucilaginibacter rigui TaxID=534635 RepID=A0ABR7X7P3_9SPHI|nr:hypothetical protein [Mucilaginibacter rigui]MBD1385832.1 hypothetical protein [Mucilaginibacter rigui]
MNRNEVISIINSQLLNSEEVKYVSLGAPVTMTSVISLEFTAQGSDFSGTVNLYSREHEPLTLKAQYDNHSTLIDNESAKKRIDKDVVRINAYINSLP